MTLEATIQENTAVLEQLNLNIAALLKQGGTEKPTSTTDKPAASTSGKKTSKKKTTKKKTRSRAKPSVSLDDLRASFKELKALKPDAPKEICETYGDGKLSSIDESDYTNVMADIVDAVALAKANAAEDDDDDNEEWDD